MEINGGVNLEKVNRKEIKYSSKKQFEGSSPKEFFGKGYYLDAEGSNYGRKDKDGKILFSPYNAESYLYRDRQVVDVLLKSVPNIKTAIVLGCARGYMVQALHERNVDAVGVDISEWAVENCAPEVAEYIFCGDVCDLSKWGDGEFDLAIALDVFEHLRTPGTYNGVEVTYDESLFKALDEAARTGKMIIIDVPINPDDLHPDQSSGTDKTHVSVYSKEFWISQFMERGFGPDFSQEYGYPEVHEDSPWPDKHDHGATIYFSKPRPKPGSPDFKSITIKPDSKKFKILWWSNSPFVFTGYGVGTKGVVYPLNKFYDIRCLSVYGLEGAALSFNNLIIYPKLFDQFGIDAAQLIVANWKPDVMVTLFDLWIGDSPLLEGQRNWFTKIHPKHIAYFPVDHEPAPDPVVNQAKRAYRAVTMSQFGQRMMDRARVRTTMIPHGVDTNTFTPPLDKEKNRKWLVEHSSPLFEGKDDPWPEGCFVIGANAMNKDQIKRKGWDKEFDGIRLFLEANPDARRDFRVYLHTWPQYPGGYPLDHLADKMGFSSLTRKTHTYHMYQGLNTEALATMYGGFNILMNASRGEGFGIPILEAAACAVPAIGTRFSSMTELIEGHGWLVDSITPDLTMLLSYMATPNEFQIADAIADAYNNPDKVKSFGAASREFSLNYDWEKVVVPLWAQLFEEIREEMRPKALDERRMI
jgi:glycosyltransferase involved in cell wall biosynthesis